MRINTLLGREFSKSVEILKISGTLAIFWKNTFTLIPICYQVIRGKQWHYSSSLGTFFCLRFANVRKIHFQRATIYSYFCKKCQNSANHPKRLRIIIEHHCKNLNIWDHAQATDLLNSPRKSLSMFDRLMEGL